MILSRYRYLPITIPLKFSSHRYVTVPDRLKPGFQLKKLFIRASDNLT
jgi:hypothetical protein